MDRLSKAEDSYGDIEDVLTDLSHREEAILNNSFGQTEQKGIGRQVGSMMSSAARWLTEEKQYAITGSAIFFSSVCILFFFGITLGRFYEVTKHHQFVFNGEVYEIVGVAKSQEGNKVIYMPVYEEKP